MSEMALLLESAGPVYADDHHDGDEPLTTQRLTQGTTP
jgi:hypothetical protein